MEPFVAQLAELCRAHPTRAKWVFVPAHATGRTLGDRLVLAGTDWANLRFVTPFEIALRMGAPFLVERGIDPSEEGLGPARASLGRRHRCARHLAGRRRRYRRRRSTGRRGTASAPPGNAGWLIPIEPMLGVQRDHAAWAQASGRRELQILPGGVPTAVARTATYRGIPVRFASPRRHDSRFIHSRFNSCVVVDDDAKVGGAAVGTVEGRVAAVEVRVAEHSVMMNAIRQSIDRLDQRLTAMDSRIDQRFALIDQRFAAIDDRFIALDAKMSRQFQFLVGIQVTMFLALAGTMISGFFALQ